MDSSFFREKTRPQTLPLQAALSRSSCTIASYVSCPQCKVAIAKRCLTQWGLAVRLLASSFDGDFGAPFDSTLTVLLTVRPTTLFAVLRSRGRRSSSGYRTRSEGRSADSHPRGADGRVSLVRFERAGLFAAGVALTHECLQRAALFFRHFDADGRYRRGFVADRAPCGLFYRRGTGAADRDAVRALWADGPDRRRGVHRARARTWTDLDGIAGGRALRLGHRIGAWVDASHRTSRCHARYGHRSLPQIGDPTRGGHLADGAIAYGFERLCGFAGRVRGG